MFSKKAMPAMRAARRGRRGFTLLEVIIAIAIIIIGLVAALVLVSKALSVTSTSSTRFIASNLAQEGIEVVRNIRDSNWLRGRNWQAEISQGQVNVDYNSDRATQSMPDGLSINQDGFYVHSSTPNTSFERYLDITKTSTEIIVKSTVTWTERGRTHSITLEDHLYDWQ